MFTLSKCYDLGKLELISSTNTEKRYVCPVCQGHSLKENVRSNAYRCFNGYCSTNDIRAKLGYKSATVDEYKAVSSSSYVKPVPLTKLEPPIRIIDYQSPTSRQLGDRTITNFSYSDTCMVERVDYKSGKKKECYPKFKAGNLWQYGSSHKFGLFNSRYIKSRGSIIISEGEKTADLVTKVTNYLTLSPPPFGWNESYISSNLFNPKITSVLYLPDNDEPGKKKANLVQQSCWMVGIQCFIFSYGNLSIRDSGDFVDLYDDGIDIKTLIEELNIWKT